MAHHSIAIVGIASQFADAPTTRTLWRNLLSKKVSFRKIPSNRWNHAAFFNEHSRVDDKTYVKKGAFIKSVDQFAAHSFGIAPRRVEMMDPQHRMVLSTVREALIDAGFRPNDGNRKGVGTFLGVSTTEYRNLINARLMAVQIATGQFGSILDSISLEQLAHAVENLTPVTAFSMPGTLLNMVAANVAHQWGFGGPAFTIDAACASSLVAVHDAVTYLETEQCDVAIAGGVYINLTLESLVGFSRIGAISKSNEMRPFDQLADGFLQGEGCGIVVLKRLEDAIRDQDHLYAVIKGSAANNDGDSSGPMAPAIEGQRRVLQAAWKRSGLDPSDATFVACHGTATPVGDPIEVQALREVMAYGSNTPPLYLGSVKANIGHTMSAAGVAGLIQGAMAIDQRTIPPLASFHTPHDSLPIADSRIEFPVEPKAWEAKSLIAGVSAFGFGGTNAHVVLQEVDATEREAIRTRLRRSRVQTEKGAPANAGLDEVNELVVFSADTVSLLAAYVTAVTEELKELGSSVSFASVARTLAIGREHHPVRLGIVASSLRDLITQLEEAGERLKVGDLGIYSPNAFAHRVNGRPKLIWMFPGQGAQKVNLMKDLFDRYPAYRAAFKKLIQKPSEILDTDLEECLYTEDTELNAIRLMRTENCQPVMAAVSLALAEWLKDAFHVSPDLTMGHSLGEFCAIAAAGRVADQELVDLITERGKLMAALQLDDPGAMVALKCSGDKVEELFAAFDYPNHELVISNYNRPDQTVVSGATEPVNKFADFANEQGVRAMLLAVSHAFHSSIVAPVKRPFAGLVDDIRFRESDIPVISAISVEPYPKGSRVIKQTLVRHIDSPVHFMEAVRLAFETVKSETVPTYFLEIGAGSTLSRFAEALNVGEDRPYKTIQFASYTPDHCRTFLRGIAQLYTSGAIDDLSALDSWADTVSLPAPPLETGSYWLFREKKTPLALTGLPTKTLVPRPKVDLDELPPELHYRSDLDANSPEALLTLFKQQMEIIQRHTEIIQSQNRVLGLDGIIEMRPVQDHPAAPSSSASAITVPVTVDLPATNLHLQHVESSPAQPASQASGSHASEAKSESGNESSVESLGDAIFTAVAEVSAFPKKRLRLSTNLAKDLGFDSLMFADLIQLLDERLSFADPIRPDDLRETHTIQDWIDVLSAYCPPEPEEVAEPASDSSTHTPSEEPAAPEAKPAPEEPSSPHRYRTSGEISRYTDESSIHTVRRLRGWERTLVPVANASKLYPNIHPTMLPLLIVTDGEPSHALLEFLELQRSYRTADHCRLDKVQDSPLYAHDHDFLIWLGASDISPSETASWLEHLSRAAKHGTYVRWTVITEQAYAHSWRRAATLFTTSLGQELRRTRADIRVRAINLALPNQHLNESASETATNLSQLLESTLNNAEIILNSDGRCLIPTYTRIGSNRDDASQWLTKEDTLVITGGTGFIGQRIARQVHREIGCPIVIIGRRDKESLPTELLAFLNDVKATYVACDLGAKDCADSLKAALKEIPSAFVLHAAAVLNDSIIAQKDLDKIQEVVRVKVSALEAVVEALPVVKGVVALSSWAAHFGNAGQSDYAAANAALDAYVASLRHTKSISSLSLAWPAWLNSAMISGISRGRRRAMAELGVEFVSDEVGVATLMKYLVRNPPADPNVLLAERVPAPALRYMQLLELNRDTTPFVPEHNLAGRMIMPYAIAIETVSETTIGHQYPFTISDMHLLRAVEIGKTPSHILVRSRSDSPSQADVFLETVDTRHRLCRHYRATVSCDTLNPASIPINNFKLQPNDRPKMLSLDDFYTTYSYHGPLLRSIVSLTHVSKAGVQGSLKPSTPLQWLGTNELTHWTMDPAIIDGLFQMVLYTLVVEYNVRAYPTHISNLHIFRTVDPEKTYQATVVLTDQALNASDSGLNSITGQFLVTDGTDVILFAEAIEAHIEPIPAAMRIKRSSNEVDMDVTPTVDLEPTVWNPDLFPEVEELHNRLEAAVEAGIQNPYFRCHDGPARNTVTIEGENMINFSSYNYLGFSGDPEIADAVKAAVDHYGTSVSASRLATGEIPLHRELEHEIASLIGVEQALVFSAGHATNESVIGHLFQTGDLILTDELAHNSILTGATLSGARRATFPHNDYEALEQRLAALRSEYNKVAIVIEGVYSMDGDIPNLPEFMKIRNKYRALLYVDEAHSMGCIGPGGRGLAAYYDSDPKGVDLWMGTLSKSFASCGGYIAGSSRLITYLKYTVPGFIFSAGISPANTAAALASLRKMIARPKLAELLQSRSRFFLRTCKALGLETGQSHDSAVVPVIIHNSYHCLKLSQRLAEEGINVQPIVYPAVDEDASRLRFFLSALHTERQLERTAEVTARLAKEIQAED